METSSSRAGSVCSVANKTLTQRGKAATKVAGSGKWLGASGKRKNLRASRRSSDLVVRSARSISVTSVLKPWRYGNARGARAAVSRQSQELETGFHARPFRDVDPLHAARSRRAKLVLHFHGLDHD